ncbi:uncharacterized protein LOC105839375 [Monomorium pharaonis]|uniref:uncharacterized protein LOC105839375 n=1 Tax=Monomorium pharaonis TaxID=307658 RepID=UPI0017475224|nr:uncharacterized protein LOC105839375 [Monomorium pharaonis]
MERKKETASDLKRSKARSFKTKIGQPAECNNIVSIETVNTIGDVTKYVKMIKDDAPSSDEFDKDLEEEYRNLNDMLDLPNDTYSFSKITTMLPLCDKYEVYSGSIHSHMPYFSPLSRGYQGGAIAIAAFATTAIHKSRCWNETVIDQIVEDGDTFYCESYKDVNTDDRRTMTVLDLKRTLFLQKKFNVKVWIEDPAYAGKFRSCNPTELHLAKALELFFERHNAGILTSPVLNIAIWKDSKYYNIFDGQARRKSGEPAADRVSGSAKLFLMKDLMGLLYIILEKSNVQNESFVIYPIYISNVETVSSEDAAEVVKPLGKARRRPSGYKICQESRAVIQGSYHLKHPAIPEALRGKGHLIVAVAALIYSRLISANEWTSALLDLIFNQSNIYLIDLVRVLEKKLDDEFELHLNDLLSDIILGVYSAKVKIDANVIPSQAQKDKITIGNGIKEFFEKQEIGILEIKKIFYAIWKDGKAYYFLDPFACDNEGFRIDYSDRKRTTGDTIRDAACVTMNSSVNEVVETVLENTGNEETDPFLIHGVKVLYVKTGVTPDSPLEKVIYRESGTNRRPQAPSPPAPIDARVKTDLIDVIPRLQLDLRKFIEVSIQYPEIMQNIEQYMMRADESVTILTPLEKDKKTKKIEEINVDEEDEDVENEDVEDEDAEDEDAEDEDAEDEDAKDEDAEDKDAEDEDAEDEDVENEDVKDEYVENEDVEIEDVEDEYVEDEDVEDEDAEDEDAEDEDAEDEDAEDKDAEDKDAEDEDVENEDVKDEYVENEDVEIEDVEDEYVEDEDVEDEDVEDEDVEDEDVEDEDVEDEDVEDEDVEEEDMGYKIINNHRIFVRGSKTCMSPDYRLQSQGRQGLIIGLTTLTYRKLKDPTNWLSTDVDQILNIGNKSYEQIITWIKQGRPEIKDEEEEEEGEEEEEEEKEIVREVARAPSHLDISLLPPRLKLAENDVFFKTKKNVVEGDANPLANLAEALERYFEHYPEMILENNKLMYAIWRENGNFFLFNPYGSDTEGWRLWNYTACFIVMDSLNELVNLLYGILEYNDPRFSLHFVALDAIKGKYKSPIEIVIPDDQITKKFQTKFLPITDEDLLKLEEKKPDVADMEVTKEFAGDKEEVLKEEEEEEEEEELEEYKDPVLPVEESLQPDAPYRLNLALLTSTVKIQDPTEEELNGLNEEIIMEKMKYDHPPPYVVPPRKTFRILLEAKLANRSIPSLVSRFSIDSRLEIKKSDVPVESTSIAIVPLLRDIKPSKIIKLSLRKYLYSRLPPIRMVPLRAIDESYIQDKEVDKTIDKKYLEREKLDKKEEYNMLEKLPIASYAAKPEVIPVGPVIKTPFLIKRLTYPDERKRKGVSTTEKAAITVKKDLCDEPLNEKDDKIEKTQKTIISAKNNKKEVVSSPKVVGFQVILKYNIRYSRIAYHIRLYKQNILNTQFKYYFKVVDEDLEIIRGNLRLLDRARIETSYFKPCYIAAIVCILIKIKKDADRFSDRILDQVILFTESLNEFIGRLQYDGYRTFDNLEIFDTNFNIILKEVISADPERSPSDELDIVVSKFLEKNQTGILVLLNCAYAIWMADDRYYLFDPYPCDERGNANEEGYCCLMRFRDLRSMLDRIKENAGETAKKSFRLYTIVIAYMEVDPSLYGSRSKRKRKKGVKRRIRLKDPSEESILSETERDMSRPAVEAEISLIELAEWVTSHAELDLYRDGAATGFTPMRNYEASMLEVSVLEDDITTPTLEPTSTSLQGREEMAEVKTVSFGRIFRNHSSVAIPIDLCIMAWSLIYDPASWSERTVNGLIEAAFDCAFDNVLASEDTSVSDMIDAVLPEFEVADYAFRVEFAPLHHGILYATEGWNLAMTLEKILEMTTYTGAIIVCDDAHVGVIKHGKNYFAWWTVAGTKSLRMIASSNLGDFLKLIVKVIDVPEEIEFTVRVVTISYARKMDPDYSDIKGLHEPRMTTVSLPEIHRKEISKSSEAIFKTTAKKPIFILGTVALRDRDSLQEPRTKRCYFVALLAVVIKRDIVQSPLPAMIDRVLEVAENLYRGFPESKFHAEHILRNVPLMNRLFNLRDCALPLVVLTTNSHTGRKDFYVQVKHHLKRYFKMHTSGILHFTNCCYGFWYSRATKCYYYLDPYRCDWRGRKTSVTGKACLCIFSSVRQMVKHMCLNQYETTTGFFIHRIHVTSIDASPFEKFQEDPMWVYLDYHWNFAHSIMKSRKKAKGGDRSDPLKIDRRFWKNYAIEVIGLIYSVWGTIGAYDHRFGERAGKNRTAICVAVLAMQNLCHPSRWNPAVLDSAVICGDSYYTESLKSLMRKCSKCENRFGLRTSFRIFPHSWTIDFGTSVYGILYGNQNESTLTDALISAFEEAHNVVIECNGITLAALATKDAYYVADPCWIGPPLFARNRGAIYVLRCKNINVLVYAITKIFNTNQRIGVYITPLYLAFDREDFDADLRITERKILPRSLQKIPGKIEDPGIPIRGAFTVPDEDSYLQYQQHLAESVSRDFQLESLQLQCTEPTLNPEKANNALVSTKWRLNLGKARSRKRPLSDRDRTKDDLLEYADSVTDLCQRQISTMDLISVSDRYSRSVDFISDDTPDHRM